MSHIAIFLFVKDVCLFFCLLLHEGFEKAKNTRRLSRDKIKKQLIDSIINSDSDFLECSCFLKLTLWCRSLSYLKLSIDLQKKSKACFYVIEVCE